MRYLAVAFDYDGTLAQDGRVLRSTLDALKRLRASGRMLLLVTGRQLEDLLGIFPEVASFDRVVAENGALLYQPATRDTKTLAEKPSPELIAELRRRGVAPLAVGHVILASWKPQESIILETIRDLGLEMQVIFNKDAVMVLPAGVNKATGLSAALKELELSPHELVGVGDAENDHAFLALCECSVAVKNALPTVKERADFVTPEDHGRGVEQMIDRLVSDDLRGVHGRSSRHDLLLGHRVSGAEVCLPPVDCNLLIAGPSSSGKSTISKSLLERLGEKHYQYCIVDPEGDYESFDGAVTVGTSKNGPGLDEILQLLKKPETNVVINLVGMSLQDRPPFLVTLLPRLQEMRARVGRPHWIIVDEAHHVLPPTWTPSRAALPAQPDRMVFITVHPDQIMPAALQAVTTVIAVGGSPENVLAQFCTAVGETTPLIDAAENADVDKRGEILVWQRERGETPFRVVVVPAHTEHRRHVRKYAEGDLPPDRCFYFRGPNGNLNLKAQNLILFNQIADGVDDATWMHHLKQGDYSRWFRDGIHDDMLADEAAKVEKRALSATESRKQIRELVERYYTLPAAAPDAKPNSGNVSRAGES